MSTCLCVHGAIRVPNGYILCPTCDRIPDPEDGFEPIVCSVCREHTPTHLEVFSRRERLLRMNFCDICGHCITCDFCGDNRIDRAMKDLHA